jgi:hypothetical protein
MKSDKGIKRDKSSKENMLFVSYMGKKYYNPPLCRLPEGVYAIEFNSKIFVNEEYLDTIMNAQQKRDNKKYRKNKSIRWWIKHIYVVIVNTTLLAWWRLSNRLEQWFEYRRSEVNDG